MTQAFNLSQLANNVNTTGQLNAAAGLYNQLPVANGGTGVATVASGNILVGAGTAAMTALAGTNVNDVVTWNGTAWVSTVSGGGPAPILRVYTSPSPWIKPASLKGVKVTVVGGGGGGLGISNGTVGLISSGGGGATGITVIAAPSIPGPVTVTVGTGGAGGAGTVTTPSTVGNPGGTGNTSSFGTLITATGGTGVPGPIQTLSPGAGGAITPSPTILGMDGVPGRQILISPGTPLVSIYNVGGSSGFGFGFGSQKSPINTSSTIGYGAGGASGNVPQTAGLNGSNGIVIVEEFY